MKTLIGRSADEVMNVSRSIKRAEKNETSFVQLEIQAEALYRLIVESRVFIEEFYCADTNAKSLVNQALLDSLASSEH